MELFRQVLRLFGVRNRQQESLNRYYVGQFEVRVWRTQRSLDLAIAPDNRDIIALTTGLNGLDVAPMEIVKAVSRLPRVACVAVTENGNGVSFYGDWH